MNVALFAQYIKKIQQLTRNNFCGKITLNFQMGNVTHMNVEQSVKINTNERKR